MARFVKLELSLQPGDAQAMDIYTTCAVCGGRRFRVRFADDGTMISLVGDNPCAHGVANLALAYSEISHYITGRQGRV